MKQDENKLKGNLDDIKKSNYFSTPDGYFEDLPMRIQKRAEGPSQLKKPMWNPVLKYALPLLLIGLIGYFMFYSGSETRNPDILTDVSAEEVIDYLDQYDYTASEIVLIAFNGEELDNFLYAPTIEEEYELSEEALFTPEWFIEEDTEEYEEI